MWLVALESITQVFDIDDLRQYIGVPVW